MIRAQIQFTEEQHQVLRRWASRQGISVSEAVRRCVEERMGRVPPDDAPDRVREALEVVGRYHSGQSDVAERHDDHLADIFGS